MSLIPTIIFQEPGEAAHKFLRKWQTNHAYQGSIEERNLGPWNRFVDQSDPVVHQNLDRTRHQREEKSLPIPPEVIALCRDPEAIDPAATIDIVEEGYAVTEFENHNVIEFNLEFSDSEQFVALSSSI